MRANHTIKKLMNETKKFIKRHPDCFKNEIQKKELVVKINDMIRFSENSFSSSLSPLKDFKTIDHTKMDEENLKSMWENISGKIIALPDDNPFSKEY
jgi:hypothetical protein